MLNVVQFAAKSRFHCPASLMSQNHKNRRVKVGASVLQTPHHFTRDEIARHSHNEQVAKVGIENQLGWNARIATAQNRGIRSLSFRQISQGLFADRRKSRLTPKETFVPIDQPLQCLVSGKDCLFHALDTFDCAAISSSRFAGACFATGAQISIRVPLSCCERIRNRAPIKRALSSMLNKPTPCLSATSLGLKPAPLSEMDR